MWLLHRLLLHRLLLLLRLLLLHELLLLLLNVLLHDHLLLHKLLLLRLLHELLLLLLSSCHRCLALLLHERSPLAANWVTRSRLRLSQQRSLYTSPSG